MHDTWEVYFYTDTDNLDAPNPIDSTKLIYLTTVPVKLLNEIEETLVINIYDITETTANLGISWENTTVKIPMTFYTQEVMEKKMDKEFQQNIFDYIIATSYYRDREINLEKAKKLQELVMELKETPNAWDYNSYGIILYKMGNNKEAISYLQRSLQMAKESNNLYLVNQNKQLLQEIEK